ncbi:MAG: phosphopantothenoylcysteine decarboxylase [Trebonia sp.]
MLGQPWAGPSGAIGVYVGSGADVYHGLEFCAVAASTGLEVSVVAATEALRAVPDEAWRSVGGCREVVSVEEVPAGHFRARGATMAVAVCFDPASDGERVARLAAGIPTVAIEPPSVRRRPQFAGPTPTDTGAPFVVLAAADGEPPADYVTLAFDALRFAVSRAQGPLQGRHIVVTAGGTREPLDPVRFITNRSSGRMGHALALAARDRGATVTLISSADRMPSPYGVARVRFHDVASLREAVLTAAEGADALVMAAAVSDYRPRAVSPQKIKKSSQGLTLELGTVPNFIPEVPAGVLRVGFAAETDPDPTKAAAKLASRGFDMLCLNDVSRSDAGFEVDTNVLCILDAAGIRAQTPLLPKTEIAHIVMEHTAQLLTDGSRHA